MEVGINYAWHSYGHDFGDAGDPPWRAGIDAELLLLKSIGITKVRWFIVRGSKVADFSSPLSAKFLTDFELLLSVFRAHGMRLLPSWIGSGMWENKAGHEDCSAFVNDATTSARFLSTSLVPLMNSALKYKDAVYAFEVASEPDLVGTSGSYVTNISAIMLTKFLQAGVDLVNAAGLPSTIGWQNINNVPKFPVTGLAIHQFHYYGWPHVLPPAPGYIIGEAPTGASGNFPELPSGQTVTDRLAFFKQKGYPLVFVWGMHSTDPETRWDATVQAQIKAFTGGAVSPPPPPPPSADVVSRASAVALVQAARAQSAATYDALLAALAKL